MASKSANSFGDLTIKVVQNKWTWIVLAALGIIWYIYDQGKKAATGDQVDLPNSGSGIPIGWTAEPAATALWNAFHHGSTWLSMGYGTDEELIWSTLDPLTIDQRAAVNNEFNTLYQGVSDMTLREWIEDDLDGSDLTRALGYFNGIPGF